MTPGRPLLLLLAALHVAAFPVFAGEQAGRGVTPAEVATLRAVASGTEDLDFRLAAIAKLGQVGDPGTIEFLFGICDRETEARLRKGCWKAITETIRRHPTPAHYAGFRTLLNHLQGNNRIRLISCVAEVGSPEGGKFLSNLLGMDPDLDPAVLSGMLQMPELVADSIAMTRLQSLLGAADPLIRRDAAHVAGKLEELGSVPHLIRLLDDEVASVQQSALWGLRNISGLRLPHDAARWSFWYAEEMRWWKEESERCFEQLDSENPAEVVAAINDLAQRTLYKDRVADRLTALTDADSDSVRLAAGAALASLGVGSAMNQNFSGGLGVGQGPRVERVLALATKPKESQVRAAKEAEADTGASRISPLAVFGGLLVLILGLRLVGLTPDFFRSLLHRG
jgi:hypothetical protein